MNNLKLRKMIKIKKNDGMKQVFVIFVDQTEFRLHSTFWPRGYKTFFMLNSAEHEIYPAHEC